MTNNIDMISEMILQRGMSRQSVAAETGMTYNALNRKFTRFYYKINGALRLGLCPEEIAAIYHCNVTTVELVQYQARVRFPVSPHPTEENNDSFIVL